MGLRHEVLTLGDYPVFRHSCPDSLLLAEFGDDVIEWVAYNEHDELVRAMSEIEQKDKRIKEFKRALSWLAGEIERDHELGRLSIDSEDCAKSARQLLLKDTT